MSYQNNDAADAAANKQDLAKLIGIGALVALAVAGAVYSGYKNVVKSPMHVVGYLGADGKVHEGPMPSPPANAVAPSKE